MCIQNQQQLNKLPIILKTHHSLFDITKSTILESSTPHIIRTDDNPPTIFRSYPRIIEEQIAVTPINVVNEITATITESVKLELDPHDSQQLVEMTKMTSGIKQKTLDNEDENETSRIRTQKFDSNANHGETFNGISLNKPTMIDNEAYPELEQSRCLLNKHIQPILSKLNYEIQTEKPIELIIIKIGIILKIYRFIIPVFDPGGAKC
jgi:hypothetical protein